jgi:hydroxyacylglutathione hydrolase
MLQVFPVPAFTDNYLWVIHDERHAVVVDPGDATPVIDYLVAHNLQLEAILVTHHHADHVGGIAALLDWHGADPPKVFGPTTENIPHRDVAVAEGMRVDLKMLGISLEVLDVPGHTAGHIAYFERTRQWLFSGDTIFAAGCGRLLGGTATQLHASLGRISQLPGETKLFCTHEYTLSNIRFARVADPDNAALAAREQTEQQRRQRGEPTLPTTVGVERASNPFLRCDTPAVKQSVFAHCPHLRADASSEQVFAALREWKNEFK